MKLKLLSLTAALIAFGAWQLSLAYDANSDGMSDVFADHYGLAQNSALEDEDGDGFTNLDESLWGTDPTQTTTAFTSLEPYASDVFIFHWDSVEGKRYGIQFTDDLTGSWSVLGNTQRGTGSPIAFGTQIIGDKGFWRLKHEGEQDLDSDGLNFMEESILQTLDTNPDSDGDYILDVNEFIAGTQPMVVDTPPVVSFDPVAGDYQDAQSVELVNLALPNYIYYTEDGTEPTLFSSKYDGTPIDTGADANLTIRAKVILPNGAESAESAATYRVGGYKVASQTVYYGWVTANAAMGYAYDPLALASGTNFQAPENYLVMGNGWIINGSFEPDTSVASQQLYYGITGTPTNGTWQLLEGYSTDDSVFWDNGFDFFNYRPVGKGWINKHDQMTADLENQSSQMIYYACIGFQFASGNYARQIYTTSSK
ncbi:MAG: chitobiase/beta-hexosaminidase C-terminal domain-containing protein, partial [Opitutales bacterium]